MNLKICSSHTSDLIDELRHRGLSHMVIQDPVKSADFAKRWLEGTTMIDEFDPYAVATLEIFKKAMEHISPRTLTPDGGVRCPLCLLNVDQRNPLAATKWVKDVTHLMWLRAEAIKGRKPQ